MRTKHDFSEPARVIGIQSALFKSQEVLGILGASGKLSRLRVLRLCSRIR
jgi:hypothetical protein